MIINMTTVTKTDFVDHKGSIDGGANYNVPPGNERCVTTIHVPSGPSSLANINLVEGLGDCYAFVALSSIKISTLNCNELESVRSSTMNVEI